GVLAQQIPLGQRRTLVRALVFRADQYDRAAETLIPEGLGGVGAGHASSDDHVGGFGRHVELLPVADRSATITVRALPGSQACAGLAAGTPADRRPGTVRLSLPQPLVPCD